MNDDSLRNQMFCKMIQILTFGENEKNKLNKMYKCYVFNLIYENRKFVVCLMFEWKISGSKNIDFRHMMKSFQLISLLYNRI